MSLAVKPTGGSAVKQARLAAFSKADAIRDMIDAKNFELNSHKYFDLCRSGQIGRARLVGVLKQLYCFSVFYERLLMRRIAEFSEGKDPRIIRLARQHLMEEGRHVDRFRSCLESNGVSQAELDDLNPKMFTKALFGYLLVTVQHDTEYVANIALMQVMESISPPFFTATYGAMTALSMTATGIISEHANEEHANMGYDLIDEFDERTMADAQRTIEDVYRLFGFMLDDWMGRDAVSKSMPPPRRRKSSRPRAN